MTLPTQPNMPPASILAAPGIDHFAITASDTQTFLQQGNAQVARGIYVGATGNVQVVSLNGTSVQYVAVPTGTIIPICCIQVKSSGTTASSLVGFI